MSRHRRRAKRDDNHAEIVKALKAAGASVKELEAVGDGFPDLAVGYRGSNYLLEVKNPATRYGQGKNDNASKTTEKQQAFREEWRGQSAVVWTTEEALTVIGARRAA